MINDRIITLDTSSFAISLYARIRVVQSFRGRKRDASLQGAVRL